MRRKCVNDNTVVDTVTNIIGLHYLCVYIFANENHGETRSENTSTLIMRFFPPNKITTCRLTKNGNCRVRMSVKRYSTAGRTCYVKVSRSFSYSSR